LRHQNARSMLKRTFHVLKNRLAVMHRLAQVSQG